VHIQKRKQAVLAAHQIEKMGNVAVFFATHIYELNKTKLLKLVYLAEELFVKKHATPFLGLPFHAWKFGPVQKELYVNLDPESIANKTDENLSILSGYITMDNSSGTYVIKPLKTFNDDNFSDDEVATLEHISSAYKYHDGNQLIFITHKGHSLWYKTVVKEAGLLERFEQQLQSTSDIILDFGDLFEDPSYKEMYYSQMDIFEFSNSLKSI
jgi:uncharacterized phage-associated protein